MPLRRLRWLGASLALAPFFVAQAQVPVVESSAVDAEAQTASADEAPASASLNANAQLFSQLQLLQEEMLRMQGEIEQQQHQIEQLKKQHLEDFIAIDKRLSELRAGAPVAPAPSPAGSATAATAGAATAAGAAAAESPARPDDAAAYRQAYDLIKQKSFGEAKTEFEKFLKEFPESRYAGNAYYWLGELYILDQDYPAAEKAFKTIIEKYPTHSKVPEAHYKLGKVYYDQGKKDAAKVQMNIVIAEYEGKADHVVALAKAFLQKHFS